MRSFNRYVICFFIIFITSNTYAETQILNDSVSSPRALDMVWGNKDAAITIVEYASLSCYHCASFHNEIFDPIKKKWIDTGKVRFIFRFFPLDEPALNASKINACNLNSSPKEYLKAVFKTQESWVQRKNYLEILANIAKLGGMKSDEIESCLRDSALEKAILESRIHGTEAFDVNATPSFFIKDRKYNGNLSEASISAAINSAYLEIKADTQE